MVNDTFVGLPSSLLEGGPGIKSHLPLTGRLALPVTAGHTFAEMSWEQFPMFSLVLAPEANIQNLSSSAFFS